MTSIVRANESDAHLLSEISVLTFMESHGNSAKPADIDVYVRVTYNNEVLKKELADPGNIYHIIYYNDRVAGYSKVVLNSAYAGSKAKNITKLERLYVLKEFYDLKLGSKLFEFNIKLVKQNGQAGVWLFVWKENQRAISFYEKKGFTIIGSYDFSISKTHSNPNHQMLLRF